MSEFTGDHYNPTLASLAADEYVRAPKHLGGIEPVRLLEIGTQIMSDSSRNNLVQQQAISASAFIEGAILLPDPDGNLSALRQAYIDRGSDIWHNIASFESELLSQGYKHSEAVQELYRARLQATFRNVYLGIARGAIPPKTQSELIGRLCDIESGYNSQQRHFQQPKYRRDAIGFLGEVRFLIGDWRRLQGDRTTNAASIPSSYRGGSGEHQPAGTHDVLQLEINDDGTIQSQNPVEIKSWKKGNPLRRAAVAGRYAAETMFMHPQTGRIQSILPGKRPGAAAP